MKISKKLLLGSLAGAVLAVSIGGPVYAIKPGNCPSIREYGPYNKHYDEAIVYEGGPIDTPFRMQEGINLNKQGIFESLVITGFPEGMDTMRKMAEDSGMSYRLTPNSSYNTTQNVREAFALIQRDKSVAHITGRKHLPRVKAIVNWKNMDPDKNDGFFPVEDTYTGTKLRPWLNIPNLREYVACVGTRFGLVE